MRTLVLAAGLLAATALGTAGHAQMSRHGSSGFHPSFSHGGFRHDGFRHDGFRRDGFFRHDGFRRDRFFFSFGFPGFFPYYAPAYYYPPYCGPPYYPPCPYYPPY